MAKSASFVDAVGLALLLALIVAWDAAGFDLPLMRHLGTPEGFPLRDAFFTRVILHEGGRWVAFGLFAYVLVSVFKPLGPLGRCTPGERRWCLATIVLCLVTIPLLKRGSLTSCPWSLQDFGGSARYVSHWAFGVRDGGDGGCFPSGHASSAFAYLPIVWALRGRDARAARIALAGLVVFGLAIGAGQTLRGAHHPSHTLWTAWICAAITAASWHGWHGWRAWSARRARH